MNNADPLKENRGRPRNVVFYGDTGAGKSSLINLIMGDNKAATSPDASVCTKKYIAYEVTISRQRFRLWDTPGLNSGPITMSSGSNEGSKETMPAPIAKKYLNNFLRALRKEDGVHLLVYCVQAGRGESVFQGKYKTFSSDICKSDVPIILAVTHPEDTMATWWDMNKDKVAKCEIPFSGHACITILANEPERREQSRQDICKVILEKCSPTPHATKYEGGYLEILMQKLARLIGLMQA